MSFLNPIDTTSFMDPLDEGAITNAKSRARGYLKSQAAFDEGRMAQAGLAGIANPIISGLQGTPAQPSQPGGAASGIGSLLGGALSGAMGGGGFGANVLTSGLDFSSGFSGGGFGIGTGNAGGFTAPDVITGGSGGIDFSGAFSGGGFGIGGM